MLPLEFFSTDSVCFVPVQFGPSYATVGKANGCDSFEFTPAALTVLFSQAPNFSYGIFNGNGFDISNNVNDLEGLHLHLRIYRSKMGVKGPLPFVSNATLIRGSRGFSRSFLRLRSGHSEETVSPEPVEE